MASRNKKWMRRQFALELAAVVLVGILAATWMAWRADRELRDHLLHEARLVAPAINIDRVKALTGTEADLVSPDYRRLKEQLAAIRAADPRFRFTYLMGRRADGAVFFYLDSEPPDSEDYSPPGQVYDEATGALRRAFETKVAVVEGPVADQWGVWISTQVPLTDPKTGAIVAVMGMDIDAGDWGWRVAAKALLPVALVVILAVVLFLWVTRARTAIRLRESEKRLSLLFQGDLFGKIIVHKGSRRILDANDAALKMLGLPRQEVIGNVCHQFVCPAEQGRCPVCDLGQRVDNSERALLTAGGRRVPILKTVTPIAIDGEDCLLESFIDISARKLAEEALRKSEHLLRTMGSLADMGGWEFDVATGKQIWTEVVYKIHEVDADYDPTVGKGLAFYTPESRPLIEQAVQRAIENGDAFDLELQIVTAKGRRRWVHALGQAVMTDGGVTRVFGTIQDVSARKAVENRLQQREATLAAITNSTQNAIMMLDPDGAISFWNPSAERILGWSAVEVIGKNLHDLIAPARFRAAHAQAYPRFVATGQGGAIGKTLELTAVRRDGSEIPVELSLSAVQLQDRWHAVGLLRDISERKRSEEEIQRAHDQLSQLVKQLEAQQVQGRVLTELREFLQACVTTSETGPVIERSMQRLFPESDGALFLMSASRSDLETIARWGGYPEALEENLLGLDECWALRRGGAYIVEKAEAGILCAHVRTRAEGLHACLPLMAKGEVLGLLHLRSRGDTGRALMGEIKEVSVALTELLSLAISNIRLREMLSVQSIKDPLTGLFNRRYLEETFVREVTRARRKQVPIGVIMVDIDHFKQFNDVNGHAAGDAVLTELAKFFTTSLRGADIMCRYGGEEFALVMPEASLENTFMRAQQLVEQVRAIRIPFSGLTLGPITLSMGVAAYPLHGEKLEELLRTADLALYRAKQSGRDRAILADTPS